MVFNPIQSLGQKSTSQFLDDKIADLEAKKNKMPVKQNKVD